MKLFLRFSEILNGAVMPMLLLLCGMILFFGTKMYKILSPRRFFKTLADAPTKGGTSPFKAMCCALAGTLGVGNIAGVATAITAGGAGAVFWMWIGALFSMSVKYGEVALAVKYRKAVRGTYVGGSMYTFRDGLATRLGSRGAAVLGGAFAAMCIVNSLVTGNIVQSSSASAVFPEISPWGVGAFLASGLIMTAIFGRDRISSLMGLLIPPLSGVYIVLSMLVIFRNLPLIPGILSDILAGAFNTRAAASGVLGVGIREAARYGITRGIFSNEAGCGTAPSAHASAEVKSPHHQGCFGIFEVIADTLILCSMSAFVVLVGKSQLSTPAELDGVPLTLSCFDKLLGGWAYYIIGLSVILFAFATIAAQLYYGGTAIGYFTDSKIPYILYVIIAACAAFYGSSVNVERMWLAADIVVGIMTAVNTVVLIIMRKEIVETSKTGLK